MRLESLDKSGKVKLEFIIARLMQMNDIRERAEADLVFTRGETERLHISLKELWEDSVKV